MGGLFSTKLTRLENHITELQKENSQTFSEFGDLLDRNFNGLLLFSSMMPDLINQQTALQKIFVEEAAEIKNLIKTQGEKNEEITEVRRRKNRRIN